MARVTPAIQVSPQQIVLNPSLDRWTTNKVTITSNTTNELVLSNPKASDSQMQVDIKPGIRKGMFNLVMITPPGFHLAPGQRGEVTVDSNNPRNPVIKVPVVQYAAPKPYAAAKPKS
jgi:hypothetical protein